MYLENVVLQEILLARGIEKFDSLNFTLTCYNT